jgi:adenine-specific DNA-methyltransferase
LNEEDKGERRYILCTNNENNICTDICYPRLKKLIDTKRNESQESDIRDTFSLRYYRTDFVDSAETDLNKKKLVDSSTEMLCLKENCFSLESEGEYFRIYRGYNDKLLGIIYDDEGIEGCKG